MPSRILRCGNGSSRLGQKEAKARIKINRLLEEAGWRFFDTSEGKANVALEHNAKLTTTQVDEMGEDFERTKNGFVDFLLLDNDGKPIVVLEAKSADKDPLIGKEQAREYANSQGCRFCILSNGDLHYLWDLHHGNPAHISRFPGVNEFNDYKAFEPNPQRLIDEVVEDDYIVLTQMPNYANEAAYQLETERENFIKENHLSFLREYQLKAVHSIQKATSEGKSRYLFEMATGTGKTLTAAAVIKLFLRTGNARRVLFLVDRLELEDQAEKAFKQLLKNDYRTVIYKQNRDDWRKADIVITTVQSVLFNNKFRTLFSPTDFDLVISDEAHRSISGNARAVFEHFIGYKLGLTATPKNYLKNYEPDPNGTTTREKERRLLLDTYRTFGCESEDPTFQYTLINGVKDGFLINPYVVDARTEITTQMLSDEGYSVVAPAGPDEIADETYVGRDFERRFFSEPTNLSFCKAFMEGALRDPISGEIGKSIVFAVSQNHAAKITQILNEMAHQLFPGKYQSDFAVQVTSNVDNSQQFTINFANNNLLGSANFDPDYKTSKARVCVTVGMMTTGYDCPDILNLALMRPVFSPSDFVQIKGRGTRKHSFLNELRDKSRHDEIAEPEKVTFKFFDFFANCQYFEEEFDYDEVITLPPERGPERGPEGPPPTRIGEFENFNPDEIITVEEKQIGAEGMRIDRLLFEKFEKIVTGDKVIQEEVADGRWDSAVDYVARFIMGKPEEFFDLDKLRKAAGADRRLSIRELLEKAFGFITKFKSKDELLEDEFEKFILDQQLEDAQAVQALRYFFKAYITDSQVREIIDNKRFADLNVNPTFNMADFQAVPEKFRNLIPTYVKDYVSINQFM